MRRKAVLISAIVLGLDIIYEFIINNFISNNIPLFDNIALFLKENLHLQVIGIIMNTALFLLGLGTIIYGFFISTYNIKNIVESGIIMVVGFIFCLIII